MHREITACRVCGNPALRTLLDLGVMELTGVFPRTPRAPLTRGPLHLVQCDPGASAEACGLVQLRQSYDASEMYGANYGYRSSLNASMARHLAGIAERLKGLVSLARNDVVVDIGSNDGTLLGCFDPGGPLLVGIDPTAEKFRRFYRDDIQTIPEFFSADLLRSRYGPRKAKLVTSISMFYDLEQPLSFMEQVRDILTDDGVWCLEQSYLPAMLRQNSYDTICHEHLEYYALKQIRWMCDRAGLEIIDVFFSDANGGSFAVTLARTGSGVHRDAGAISAHLASEAALDLDGMGIFNDFRGRIEERKSRLLALLDGIRASAGSVMGYGASTKGNVLLQYCGIGPERLPCIAEINEDKFGCYTPGTAIPIVSDAEARARKPDYFLVLPWHLRAAVLEREREFLAAGGRLIFPLPEVEIVSA